jgi:hypothetical protein
MSRFYSAWIILYKYIITPHILSPVFPPPSYLRQLHRLLALNRSHAFSLCHSVFLVNIYSFFLLIKTIVVSLTILNTAAIIVTYMTCYIDYLDLWMSTPLIWQVFPVLNNLLNFTSQFICTLASEFLTFLLSTSAQCIWIHDPLSLSLVLSGLYPRQLRF